MRNIRETLKGTKVIIKYHRVRESFFIAKSPHDMHFRSGSNTRIENTDELDKYIVNYLDYGYSINDFDPTLDKIINGRLNVDDVIKRHRRVRRSVTKKDTIEHVTKIMESIEEELDDLKVTFDGR